MRKLLIFGLVLLFIPLVFAVNSITYDGELPCVSTCFNVATDSNNNIYVATFDGLFKYNPDLSYNHEWPVLSYYSVVDNAGNIYFITADTNNIVQKISGTTGLVSTIISSLNHPLFLDIYNNELYITMSTSTGYDNSDIVKKYTLDGTLLSDNVVQTTGIGYISGIQHDSVGNLYLSIYGGYSASDPHMRVYSPTGGLLRQLIMGQTEHGMFDIDDYNKIVYMDYAWAALNKSSITGEYLTGITYGFNFISNVAVSGSKIYVADEGLQKILIFNNINDGTYCGDWLVEGLEQCDNGANNGGSCPTNTCSLQCTLQCYCGDNICIGETTASCFRDCDPEGWHTDDDGWQLLSNQLVFDSAASTSVNGVIYSDPVDLRAGTYTLSATISSSDCTIRLDLNSANCTDAAGVEQTNCFTNQELPSNGGTRPVVIANNGYFSPDGFLKGVKIRIRAENCGDLGVIDSVSLTEVSTANIEDAPISGVSPYACCPAQWCWNGNTCVNSSLWMDNSTYPPIWNPVFNTTRNPWINEHVNSTYQNQAKGYRCTNNTGSAEWTVANIKYDWNFKGSGYCNLPTDCFVNASMNYLGGRAGCIHDGEYISNDMISTPFLNRGLHYCDNGNWSTRTQLMANNLVSFANGQPFILFCDTNNNTFNFMDDADMNTFSGITGACTIVIKKSSTDEQVITAFYIDGDDFVINNVLDDLILVYGLAFGNNPLVPSDWGGNGALCVVVANSNFTKCTGTNTNNAANSDNLHIYYHTYDHFFVLSHSNIDSITPSIWIKIRDFFSKLFRINPQTPVYGFFNQTTNFNNVYIMNNTVISAIAVQEDKYDENITKMFNYTYINYTTTQSNKLNWAYLNSIYGDNFTYSNYGSPATGYGTEIFIKSNNKIVLWPYLTAMLRDRDTPNP